MKSISLLIVFVSCAFAHSSAQQNEFMINANGKPLFWGSTYLPDGSPYFNEEYNWAEIITVNNRIYKDIRVKFNLMDRVIQYLDDKGNEMITTLPVRSIRFPAVSGQSGTNANVLFRSDSGAINIPDATIYQVLQEGKASLAKKIDITYRDEKKYGEATTTRHFDRKESEYILLPNNKSTKIEKNKSFIIDLLNDKKNEIEKFITANNLKCKSISDFILIIAHYNSL